MTAYIIWLVIILVMQSILIVVQHRYIIKTQNEYIADLSKLRDVLKERVDADTDEEIDKGVWR